ncbi:Sec-independent protein translocase protein TatB [Labrys monachus]|uniref:Sec-independent protein translocase protein TatB n=1 Tax=Labrys monachus TaxID=217067 RepID=A0ABU0FEH6_9HYPH|nr:Sec-independent protein translocase protein TatB [Labrys monachus]MDQ0393007.1 Tat protein translocase TatB subunit [Labrys monachus]
MFDIGWSELLIVGVVAVVAIGPRELPNTMRSLGRGLNKVRRMAGEFQGQFNQALKEANLEDVKKEFDVLRQSAAGISSVMNPLGVARNVLSGSMFPDDPSQSAAPVPSAVAQEAPAPSIGGGRLSPSLLGSDLDGVDIPSAFAPLAVFRR